MDCHKQADNIPLIVHQSLCIGHNFDVLPQLGDPMCYTCNIAIMQQLMTTGDVTCLQDTECTMQTCQT